MIEKQLFQAALEIEDPVYISEVVFSSGEGELHLHLDFHRGGKFSCPECHVADLPVHDTMERSWRYLNFFQYKCFVHMRIPRVKCDCGVYLWSAPWAGRQSGFTLMFEAFVMTLAREMPVSSIAELVGEYDKRLWRIIRHYVSDAYAKKSFAEVAHVGMDETSSLKGHKYVSIFTDMDSGAVLFATEGKNADTVGRFARELPLHGCDVEQITEAVADMSPAFISGIGNHLPKANVTFNKFHVIKALNAALDQVRRSEQANNPLLKKTRYVWLKNPEKLTAGQAKKLHTLRFENLKTAKVYQMKLTFQDIYRSASNSADAAVDIKKWLSWAVRSRLEPVKKFAQMIKSHWEGALRYFDTRLTTGRVEGINSRIQEIKRRAKGFRNIDNFISMIYLEAANLNFKFDKTHTK